MAFQKAATPAVTATSLNFKPPSKSDAQRVCLYGTAKIGKTSLAMRAPGPVVFFDLDKSLGHLDTPDGVLTLEADTYDELYSKLNAPGWDDIRTVVIDSATALETLAETDVLQKIRPKSGPANSIEDYGFGKGYRYLYDRLDRIVQALDNHVRAGRNVILICHEHTGYKPNAMGEDFLTYSPDLLETKQFSFRERVKSWADHILFVSYDVNVSDRKGTGSGSRTIYTRELPMLMAGSRTIKKPQVPYAEGSDEIWRLMFGSESTTIGESTTTTK